MVVVGHRRPVAQRRRRPGQRIEFQDQAEPGGDQEPPRGRRRADRAGVGDSTVRRNVPSAARQNAILPPRGRLAPITAPVRSKATLPI